MEKNMKQLINLNQVMAKLGVSRSQVYNLINQGKLPAPKKIGASSRWVDADIDAFIDELPSNSFHY